MAVMAGAANFNEIVPMMPPSIPMNATKPAATHYPTQFRQGVSRMVKIAYDRLLSERSGRLSPQVRERALWVLDFGLGLDEAWPVVRELLLTLSPKMEQSGTWTSWISYLHKGLARSRDLADDAAEAAFCLQLGLFAQRQGELDAAKGWYEDSIQLARSNDNRAILAQALNRLAYMAALQHKDHEALRYIEKAMIVLTVDSPDREFCYFVQGWVALNQRQWATAIMHFQQSIDICQQNGDKHSMARRLHSLGIAHQNCGDYQQAQITYEEALILLQEIEDPIEEAIIYINQGSLEGLSDNWSKSLIYFSKAQPILQKVRNGENLAKLYNNQGFSHYQLQQWPQAEAYYQASLEQWAKLDNPLAYANALDGLGLVYQNQGRYPQSIQTFQNALQHLAKFTRSPRHRQLVKEITEHLQEIEYLSAGD